MGIKASERDKNPQENVKMIPKVATFATMEVNLQNADLIAKQLI